MKVFVVHDVKGNIRSIGVPGTPGQTLAPESGQIVSEIDVAKLDQAGVGEPAAQLHQLRDVLKNQRVQRVGEQATLVPLPAGKTAQSTKKNTKGPKIAKKTTRTTSTKSTKRR